MSEPETQTVTLAVIGNPNTGKTTVFNQLTGLSQQVGNFPGCTVEKRIGFFQIGHLRVRVIDMPGTYSLSANSPDEMIVVDKNIITSTGPSTGLDVAFRLLEMLTNPENVATVKKYMRFE